jgi:hypothetical protein
MESRNIAASKHRNAESWVSAVAQGWVFFPDLRPFVCAQDNAIVLET